MSVVIIGAGQGGLSAAIYSRLAGHDVLVLEKGCQAGGKAAEVRIGEYRLDPGPSIIILPRIYDGVFRDAGRRMEDYLRFKRLDPISRVFMEGESRVDLPAGMDECVRLLKDIAPMDAEPFRRLMASVGKISSHIDQSVFAHPYLKSWQLMDPHLMAMGLAMDVRSPYKTVVDRTFQSPLLRAFFYGFPSYGGQTYDRPAPGAMMIPYLMLSEGVFYPEGGVSAIPKAFRRLAEELGVEFRFNAEVTGFESEGRRVSGVQLASGEKIEGSTFISNVDRETTRSMAGHLGLGKPNLSYFTVHMGVRRRFEQLDHHTLFIPKGFESGFGQLYRERRFPDSPIVYVNDPSSRDATAAPPGCTNFFAVVTSPAEESHIDWEAQGSDFMDKTLRQLQTFGLSIDRDEVDFTRIQTPSYFRKAHGNYGGSLYGVDEKERIFGGIFPHHNRDENFENLLYCGGSVQPGAGLPMVTLSGKFAAGLIRN